MSLVSYRTHLDGLDLTEKEMIELEETITAIVTNIVEDLFMRRDGDHDQHRTT